MCNIFIFIYVWKGKERGYIERNVKKTRRGERQPTKGASKCGCEEEWMTNQPRRIQFILTELRGHEEY